MKYLTVLPFVLITALLWGQDTDNKRMKRDIEVAENILSALIEETVTDAFPAYQVEGTYLDGYGALFTIQNQFGGMVIAPQISWNNDRIIQGRVQSRLERNERDRNRDRDRDRTIYGNAITIDSLQTLQRHLEREDRDRDRTIYSYGYSTDSLQAFDEEKFKAVSETFLTDYAHLLTQLPNNERVCLKYAATGNKMGYVVSGLAIASSSNGVSIPGFTAVTTKQAVEDYRGGKIDRKALIAKIDYSKTEAIDPKADRELILLNSIFSRLYQRDLSEGFVMRGQGNVEQIAGLGALFTYNFSSDRRRGFYFNMNKNYFSFDRDQPVQVRPQKDDQDEDEEDEDEEEPDFGDFLDGFKANVIEYGSTVRNLDPQEVLSFELKFPRCEDCDERPQLVKITAKQGLLERYRKGNIDLEEAKEELQVTY